MKKRILVTGGTGFIGRHSLVELVRRQYDVVAFTSRPAERRIPGVEFVEVSLLDRQQMSGAVKEARCTHLLHLAWHAVIGGLWTAPENLSWLRAGLDLGEAFLDAGGTRIVVSGSCGEYDWAGGLCRESSTPLSPATYYGNCKLALFHALAGLCGARGAGFAWGRAFFVYGPYEHPSRLAASVVLSLLRGQEALCSHGMQLRDYMHSADVGRGLAALADSDLTGDFNLASGEAIRVKDLILGLAEAVGRPDLVRLGARPPAPFEPPLIVADMDKTRSSLDWKPEFLLDAGIADTVGAFRYV